MNDSWTERLSEYLDGELSTEERTLCEAHVATCDACRTALDDLRDVVTRARALPEIPPAQDLWPSVAARIAAFAQEAAAAEGTHAARPFTVTPVRGVRGPARSFSFTWPQLAAAGLALVALSSGISWFAAHRAQSPNLNGVAQVGSSTTAGSHERTGAGSTGEPSVSRASTQGDAAQRRYDATVADLQKALEQHRDELDPQTVATIEANMKIIDLAASQARKALNDDPGNAYLKDHLSKTMQRKVDLLREATQLASATPGNP